MKNLFLKKKPCAMLLLLKDSSQQWYPSKLARESGSSYVHTVNLLSVLKSFGAVVVEKKGKQSIYRLTEKGQYMALSLDDFSKKCDGLGQEPKKPEPHAVQPEKQAEKPQQEKEKK
jgi:predicted transcriptional regulator